MGRIGKFIVGGILIGASFIVGGPGASAFAAGLASMMLAGGVSLVQASIFSNSGISQRQDGIMLNAPNMMNPLPVIYGKTKVGITPVDIRTAGAKNEELWIVGALCHGSSDGNGIQGIDEVYFDNKLAIDASSVVQEPWAGNVTMWKFFGTYTQNVSNNNGGATPHLNSTFPTQWPSATSKGLGVACVVLRLTFNKEKFASGIPNVTINVRGNKVQDPRIGGANVYSTNPALCINDYLQSTIFGLGATLSEVDITAINAMANYYDELVSVPPSGSQKRFEMNGWLDVGQSVPENIRQMLTSCRGNLVYEGGKFRLFTRSTQTAETYVLDESNICGDWSFRMPGIKDCGNFMIVTYLNPDQDLYQSDQVTYPRVGASNTYLTNDNNYLVEHRIELPMTVSKYTAEQIGNVTLKETRAGLVAQVTCRESALQLRVGDVVNVTHSTPAWISKPFWVMAMLVTPEGLVRLTLLEYDSNAYTLDAQTTLPFFPATGLPDPSVCQPPTELDLTATAEDSRPDADGSDHVYITASWLASPDPFLSEYEVQYKLAGTDETVWLPVANTQDVDLSCEIGPVSEGLEYAVRVRAKNTLGVKSGWIQDTVRPHLDISRVGSFCIDDFSSETPGRRWVPVPATGYNLGEFKDYPDPDAIVGGSVARATGSTWYEFADNIPYDGTTRYVMRMRVRQLRDPSTGSKTFSLGVSGVCKLPGQSEKYGYINQFGQNTFDNQHFILAQDQAIPVGRKFVDFYGYLQGYAGGLHDASLITLTHSGLGSFNATNCMDGDTTPTQVGFSTDAATSGAYLKADFGTAQYVTEVRLHMSADGATAKWDLEFSDDNSTWFKAAADVVFAKKGWESGSTLFAMEAAVPPGPPNPPPTSGFRSMIAFNQMDPSLWGRVDSAPDSTWTSHSGSSWANTYLTNLEGANTATIMKVTQGNAFLGDVNNFFSTALWIANWDAWYNAFVAVSGAVTRLRDLVAIGKVRAMYVLDDFVSDFGDNAFAAAVTFEQMETICAHVKVTRGWDWMPLVARGPNSKLRAFAAAAGAGSRINGVRQYVYLDAGWAQFRYDRFGDPGTYIREQADAGEDCALGCIGGANILSGGLGNTPGWGAQSPLSSHFGMSPSELTRNIDNYFGDPRCAGFPIWSYSITAAATTYVQQTAIKDVLVKAVNTYSSRSDGAVNIRGDLGTP